jgi:hypothetical protein
MSIVFFLLFGGRSTTKVTPGDPKLSSYSLHPMTPSFAVSLTTFFSFPVPVLIHIMQDNPALFKGDLLYRFWMGPDSLSFQNT